MGGANHLPGQNPAGSRSRAKRPIETESRGTGQWHRSELYHRGSREVTSREIGEMVMQNLRRLDEVAYIRFATIYRRFADVEDLADEIESACRNAGNGRRS